MNYRVSKVEDKYFIYLQINNTTHVIKLEQHELKQFANMIYKMVKQELKNLVIQNQ